MTEPGRVEVVEEDLDGPGAGQVLLSTVATGISAGTELTFVKGDNPALSRRLDRELGVFGTDGTGTGYPVRRLGYMEVARVQESRTPAVPEGALVAAAYGHVSAHVADPVRDHLVLLPEDLDPVLGTWVAHMGPICANGLLHAAADATGGPVASLGDGVRGRCVLVTGAGLVGLLVAVLAREHGAAEVAVVDADPRRRAVAQALGLLALPAVPEVGGGDGDGGGGPSDDGGSDDGGRDDAQDPALVLKTRWRHGAGDHGADVVLQCRGRGSALATALRAVRPQGTVVDLAFHTGGLGDVRLGEEFHHNGLSLRSAQISRVPRGLAPTWDRARLSRETVALLAGCGDELRRHLVTDVVPFEQGPALLLDLAGRRRHVLSAVLTC